MKKRVLYPILAVALVLAMGVPVGMHMAMPVMAATVTFTGNVTVDFVGPGILIIPDPVGDVGLPAGAPAGAISGWDMEDLRLTYDAATDTLYVGINTPRIAGDADGDGDPGGTSAWLAAAGGTDRADLGGTETIAVYFDLDKDGVWDVIAGVGNDMDITDFRVAEFQYLPGNVFSPPFNFGTPLPANTGTYYASPSAAAPHFEFTIRNFSTLPGSDSSVGGFRVGAFMGSLEDDGIGEDYILYEQNPHTIVTIVSSAPKVVSGGSVSLNVTESNPAGPHAVNITDVQVEVTKGGAPLATLVWPPDSGDDGDGILNPGETWSWNISSGAITGTTTFVARGSGTAPGDFPVNHLTDPLEEDDVTVDTINPNTAVTIAVNATTVVSGGSVSLNVTEANTGDDPLTSVRVEIRQGATLIATLYQTHANWTDQPGGNGDAVLDVGETWRWNNIPSNAITAATTFEALGFGTDSLGNEVSYASNPTKYAGERATVTVNTIDPNTAVTITPSATTVVSGGTVSLNVTETNTGDDPLTNVRVEVRKNGILIHTLVAPPSSGDTGNDGILGVGETWRWNNVSGGAITALTTFEALGFGTDSLGNEVSYASNPTKYAGERATVTVNTVRPNTAVTVTPSATTVVSGGSVNLTVTEANTGAVDLISVRVEVRQGATLIATLDHTHPSWTDQPGGNGDAVLDVGETWRWNSIPSNPITAATTFEALGFGTDPLGNVISYPAYPTERATVRVEISGEGCLTVCKFQDSNVNGIRDHGEPGLPDWRFRVQGPGGYDRWVTTGPDGCVKIDDLLSGTYTVTEEMQSGWYSTKPGGAPPYRQTVSVQVGTDCTEVEFGNREERREIPVQAPSMNDWGMIIMISVFAGLLVWTLRRRQLALGTN